MNTVARLINIFTPHHYSLTLNLLRKERRFSGEVIIEGTTATETQHILLHGKDLIIHKATIDDTPATYALGKNDEITFKVDSPLLAGKHIIAVQFEGTITDPMHGLYPCYYKVDGKKKELLATQFESHHAREVFLSIDEPAAKATFDVTLTTETGITVLGNMPVKEQQTKDSRLTTTFETSPRMSTYLLAFVVGDLQSKSGTTKGGTEVNIWATHAQPAESLDFALDTSIRTIEFFNDYFGAPYPLPKADHVALPDFSSGAMENWGLITYREACLLVDPKTTAITSREYIATVIVHELSHQWFGNLVTMAWWDDLWLNESFASLMEYIGVDALFPEWNVWLSFTTGESLGALRRDSLPGVQAVKTEVHHPDEINTLFDPAIVYAKGARILRMLRTYIGEEAFQQGLKAYFVAHAYKNTSSDDLWQAFADVSHKNIKSFMEPWLQASGFPVVSATAHGTSLELSQQQFIIGEKADPQRIWPIPLNANQATVPALMDEKTLTATIAPDLPLKLNQNDTAHFITHYDKVLMAKLGESIADKTLPPVDRLQLLHEASLLPRAGIGTAADFISLLDVYKGEDVEPVWDIISLVTSELRRFVEQDSEAEKGLRKLSGTIAHSQYARLGWDKQPEETESDTKLRTTILAMMLYAEDKSALSEALKRYDAAAEIADIDNELISLILGTAVRHHPNKHEVIDRLLKVYSNTASSDIQQDISSALTCSWDKEAIERLLAALKDTDVIRPQDTPRWFVYLMRNRKGRPLAWQWLRDNWAWVESTFSSDKSYDVFPRYAAMTLSTAQQLEEYRTFFTPLIVQPGLTRAIEIGLREIEGRVEWIERDQAGVVRRLIEY
jgi:aminopeptidase N